MPEGALSGTTSAIPSLVESVLRARGGPLPAVTVSWAQSREGAIAQADGARAILSSAESMALTHRLRSLHRAILVGIGTVLADDPLLTVRLVQGPSPQPIVLDSALRFPVTARLLARAGRAPWVFHAPEAPDARARELARRGARLFALPREGAGLPLGEVLRVLGAHGIDSLMVEGGARVLRSFIDSGLANQAVITLSPVRMQGLRIFETSSGPESQIDFAEARRESCGRDTILWGRFRPPS